MLTSPSTSGSPRADGRLDAIDGWRCIAVSLVVISHLGFFDAFSHSRLEALFAYGAHGVWIFFFISGFVVSLAAHRESDQHGRLSPAAFYVRRVFRIVPPLVFYVAVMLLAARTGPGGEFSPRSAAWSLSYLCNTSFTDCSWLGGHTWSLGFEEQFYLMFPTLFCLVRFRSPPPMLFWAAAAFATLPLIWAVPWIGRSGFFLIYGLFIAGYVMATYEPLVSFIQSNALIVFPLAFAVTFAPPELFGSYYKFAKLACVVSIPGMVVATLAPGRLLSPRRSVPARSHTSGRSRTRSTSGSSSSRATAFDTTA